MQTEKFPVRDANDKIVGYMEYSKEEMEQAIMTGNGDKPLVGKVTITDKEFNKKLLETMRQPPMSISCSVTGNKNTEDYVKRTD